MATGKPKSPKQNRALRADGKKSKFKNPNRIPLGKNRAKAKTNKDVKQNIGKPDNGGSLTHATASQQLSFFIDRFESANGVKLSSLELEGIRETFMVENSHGLSQDAENLSKHLKPIFGASWKEVLYEGQPVEGKIEDGNPAVLIICSSALRALELLRGLKPLTRECRAAKLFAKHLKVEDQESLLKNRVNLACGTPNRIKKLIDMDVLGLSRLAVLVLDMHTDAKGYSLFSLPQVSGEFWDLYKVHFHQRFLQGDLRICLYGQVSTSDAKNADPVDENTFPATQAYFLIFCLTILFFASLLF
ncbi:hypothetical protein H6P81_013612 [Aristolochia fimbriata]|uniref:Protein CMSS1 n=1 Tax=Aristolochia fimbriata TaxID=158543 RepID=A0AAV7EFK9_ARIFI|nr:hypothetical protein H6P81_013612 [Aristolochia fimbriata]